MFSAPSSTIRSRLRLKSAKSSPGKSGDQIGVDDPWTSFFRQCKGLFHVIHRMGAPYKIQGVLLHGLRIDADTIYTVVFHDTQFPFCYGVRPMAGFHGKFPKMGQVKMFLDLLQKASSAASSSVVGVPPPIYRDSIS